MENLKAAIFGHPEPSPDWSEPLPYLLEVPSAFASSSSLRRFERETLRPLMQARPNDGYLQAVAVRLAEVSAYRAALPPARSAVPVGVTLSAIQPEAVQLLDQVIAR